MPLFYFLELGKVTIILQEVKNTNTVNSFHILSARSMTISFSIILHSTFNHTTKILSQPRLKSPVFRSMVTE